MVRLSGRVKHRILSWSTIAVRFWNRELNFTRLKELKIKSRPGNDIRNETVNTQTKQCLYHKPTRCLPTRSKMGKKSIRPPLPSPSPLDTLPPPTILTPLFLHLLVHLILHLPLHCLLSILLFPLLLVLNLILLLLCSFPRKILYFLIISPLLHLYLSEFFIKSSNLIVWEYNTSCIMLHGDRTHIITIQLSNM